MAKVTPADGASAEAVFQSFERLSAEDQVKFVRLACRRGKNAIAALAEDCDLTRLDEMIAAHELQHANRRLDARTRKPDEERRAKVVKMRDKDLLTFGQIGKRTRQSRDAARQMYYRAKRDAAKPKKKS